MGIVLCVVFIRTLSWRYKRMMFFSFSFAALNVYRVNVVQYQADFDFYNRRPNFSNGNFTSKSFISQKRTHSHNTRIGFRVFLVSLAKFVQIVPRTYSHICDGWQAFAMFTHVCVHVCQLNEPSSVLCVLLPFWFGLLRFFLMWSSQICIRCIWTGKNGS